MDNQEIVFAAIKRVTGFLHNASTETSLALDVLDSVYGGLNDAMLLVNAFDRSAHDDLYKQAVKAYEDIWNFAMLKKASHNIDKVNFAKLREMALRIASWSENSDASTSFETQKKCIMMYLKTAESWLDADNVDKASSINKLFSDFIQKVQEVTAEEFEKNDPEKFRKRSQKILKERFRCFCQRLEIEFKRSGMGCDGEMKHLTEQCKQMLQSLSEEAPYLAMLCYNNGVTTYRDKQFSEAIGWLEQSHEIGATEVKVAKPLQARTLRLLACALLDRNLPADPTRAVNAASLSLAEETHCSGFFVKIRALLQINDCQSSSISEVISAFMSVPEFSPELGMNLVRVLAKAKRTELAIRLITDLERHSENIAISGSLLLLRCDVLLNNGRRLEALEFIERLVLDNSTGINNIDCSIKRQLHNLIWTVASEVFEECQFSEALRWYHASLNLLSVSERSDPNVAKIHRNRATCYMQTGEIPKAVDAVEQALLIDNTSPRGYYLLFRLAIAESNQEKANEAVRRLCSMLEKNHNVEPSQDLSNLIISCAQMALNKFFTTASITSLSCLIKVLQDPVRALLAIRCLLRILITTGKESAICSNKELVLCSIEKAYSLLCKTTDESKLSVRDEATWFMKFTWNLALSSKDDTETLYSVLIQCHKFCLLIGSPKTTATKRIVCLVMSAGAALTNARNEKSKDLRKQLFAGVLDAINQARESILSEHNANSDTENVKDNLLKILLSYEFEAHIGLCDDSHPDTVFERVLHLPNIDAGLLENMAYIAATSENGYEALAARAYKAAIGRRYETDIIDFEKLEFDIRKMGELCLESNDICAQDKLDYYAYIKKLLTAEKIRTKFNSTVVVWLMARAWNYGIEQISHNTSASKTWCEVAMNLLALLPADVKSSYESKMIEHYTDLLANDGPSH